MKFDLQRFADGNVDGSVVETLEGAKSYTLADGSTVTVTATEQGIPFNEGMDVITKAIKARVNVRDGSSGTGGASSVDFFGISPSQFNVTAGESATATVVGGNFSSLTISNAQSWCSINDRIITVAPGTNVTPGTYSFRVQGYAPSDTSSIIFDIKYSYNVVLSPAVDEVE